MTAADVKVLLTEANWKIVSSVIGSVFSGSRKFTLSNFELSACWPRSQLQHCDDLIAVHLARLLKTE